MKNNKLRFVLLSLSLLLALLMLRLAYVSATVQAKQVHMRGSIDGWPFEYVISEEDDGSYIVTYRYARASVGDVSAARAAFNRAAAKFAGERQTFKTTLVFTRPLSIDEFRAFARSFSLAPIANIMRGIDSTGQAVTLGVPPEWRQDGSGHELIGQPNPGGDPINSEGLARFRTGPHQIRPVGVISTDVTLDRGTFAKLQHDQRVFAVDTMAQVVLEQLHQQQPSLPLDKVYVQGSVLYPALEDVGLAPKVSP